MKQKKTCETVYIDALQPAHVCQLLSDALYSNEHDVQPLAKICFEKTQGNPFFLSQFLSTLYEDDCLKYMARYSYPETYNAARPNLGLSESEHALL